MPSITKVSQALEDKEKVVIAQVAPALRVSIGEEFGMPPGTIVTNKLVGALKKLGFDLVFDTSFGADVVVYEEAAEIRSRIKKGKLPVFNSCCPSLIKFAENCQPGLIKYISTTKSPMETMGTLIKTYFAERNNLDPETIFVVSIMPCTVKKIESKRQELSMNGQPIIDEVLTTLETASLMRMNGIDLNNVKEAEFDAILGKASGGGKIFGTTGGISEAVLRELSDAKQIEFKQVHGLQWLKECEIKTGKENYKVAIVNGLQHMSDFLKNPEKVKKYTFVEVMSCFGGCIGGAGQPTSTEEILKKRQEALYKIDKKERHRVCTKNPAVAKIYREYLGKPYSEKAKKLLHTRFFPKKGVPCRF
jgi:iron-only hydrogenase group A